MHCGQPGAYHVQIVENAEADYLLLRRALLAVAGELEFPLRVTRAVSTEDALQSCREGVTPDLLIVDVYLTGESGLKLPGRLRDLLPQAIPPIVMTSSFPRETLPAEQMVGLDYLPKTLRPDELRVSVKDLLSSELGSARYRLLSNEAV